MTVFSKPDYRVKIDDKDIDPRDIISMRLTRKAEKLPVKGVVQSELYISLRCPVSFSPNARITLSAEGDYLLTFADHFISRIRRKGEILTIYAHDNIRTTDNMFDDSGFMGRPEPYFTHEILQALASQCEFAGTEDIVYTPSRLYRSDIHGKTCREILELVSQHTVGVFFCSNENRLCFTPFMSPSVTVAADDDKSSCVYLHSVKGPFRQVYALNTATDEVFSSGYDQHFTNILKLEGRLFSKSLADEAYGRFLDKELQAFACSHIHILGAPDGITAFTFRGRGDMLSVHTVVRFGGSEIYAEAVAADICEDESDYIDVTGYELRKRLVEGRKYGSMMITDRGIGFSANFGSDAREAEVSYFEACPDKVISFDGVMLDKTMPDSIESVSSTSKRVKYGDSSYLLSFDVDAQGKKSNIRFQKEEST